MTRESLHRHYLGDQVVDWGEYVASIHLYTGRCHECGQWVGATTIAHGLPMCRGRIVTRSRVTVHLFPGPDDFSPGRFRLATPSERRAVLTTLEG